MMHPFALLKEWTAALLATPLMLVGAPESVLAQRSLLEFEIGPGYTFGGGAENPAPSLPTVSMAGVLWFSNRWGIAIRYNRSFGEDSSEASPPFLLGTTDLRYSAVTLRRRATFKNGLSVDFGVGAMLDMSFDEMILFPTASDPNRIIESAAATGSGFALDALVGRRWWRHFGTKGGVTLDFNPETSNFSMVALAVFPLY